MSFVKVSLLRLLELFVLLSEHPQISPIWHQQLVSLWDRCLNPPSHAELSWTEITPGQRCCAVAQQSQIGILWPLQQPFHGLNCPLHFTVAQGKSRAAHGMVELVYYAMNIEDVLWTISGIPCRANIDLTTLITVTDVVLVNLWVPRKIIHNE